MTTGPSAKPSSQPWGLDWHSDPFKLGQNTVDCQDGHPLSTEFGESAADSLFMTSRGFVTSRGMVNLGQRA